MLLDDRVEIKWNSRNKEYYQSKGYEFTKSGDLFFVNIRDLQEGSNIRVRVKCDYCEDGCRNISFVKWADYIKIQKRNVVSKDCCGNKKCMKSKLEESNIIRFGCKSPFGSKKIQDKAKETIIEKYGVENVFSSKEIQQKIKVTNLEKYGVENPIQNLEVREKSHQTNLEKYGTENPFASEEIKEKIRNTNMEKYGVEVPTQKPEIRTKGSETCLEKYGVINYGAIYSAEHKGELSARWKGGPEYHGRDRATYEYRDWRKAVFERDSYTCQSCGYKNRIGLKPEEKRELNAHHIKNWRDNEDVRYDVGNGITFCEKCHLEFHAIYGKKNNTKEQLEEFLNLDKKIC